MNHYGVIIRQLRTLAKLSVQQAAKKTGRSIGWLSEIETCSGRCRISDEEFNRIVLLLDGNKYRSLFKTWAAMSKNVDVIAKTYDGAVLKYIRIKKDIGLLEASKLTHFSVGYISKLETGKKPVSLEIRNQIMTAYGYSPTSFKNLSTDPNRSKAVPSILKLEILINHASRALIDDLYAYALKAVENQNNLDGGSNG